MDIGPLYNRIEIVDNSESTSPINMYSFPKEWKTIEKDKNKKLIENSIKTNYLSFTQEILDDSHLELIGAATNLTNLSIYDCVTLNNKLFFLLYLTNLTHLELSFSNIDDSDLICLKYLTNLQSLVMIHNKINGSGFSDYILPSLKYIKLYGGSVSIGTITDICRSAPNLTEFDYSYDEGKCFNNQCLEYVCSNLKLVDLVLAYVNITDYSSLANCLTLTSLVLLNPDVTDYTFLAKCLSLKEISIHPEYQIFNVFFPLLPDLESLSTCEIVFDTIYDSISSFTSLQKLDIITNNSNLSNIAHMTKLTELHAKYKNMTNVVDLSYLSKLVNLVNLDLRYAVLC